MTRYEFATLSIQTGTAAKVIAGVERYLDTNASRAKLFAVWTAEIGTLNQVQVVRGFETSDALHTERERMLRAGDLFGATEYLTGLSLDTYTAFPFFAPLPTGAFGSVYEVRVYNIKPARPGARVDRMGSRHTRAGETVADHPRGLRARWFGTAHGAHLSVRRRRRAQSHSCRGGCGWDLAAEGWTGLAHQHAVDDLRSGQVFAAALSRR